MGEVSSRYTSLSHPFSQTHTSTHAQRDTHTQKPLSLSDTHTHAPTRKHTRTPLSLTDTHTNAPTSHTKHHRNISDHLDIPLQQQVQTSLHRHHDQHQEPPCPIGMTVSRHSETPSIVLQIWFDTVVHPITLSAHPHIHHATLTRI